MLSGGKIVKIMKSNEDQVEPLETCFLRKFWMKTGGR